MADKLLLIDITRIDKLVLDALETIVSDLYNIK